MTAFDAHHYKSTTRQQWEEAAGAWHRWGPTLEAWLGDATERMLDAAEVAGGSRVVDVAAGAGGQTLAAARRAGPGGHVLATDISPAILAFAAREATEAGLDNVETRELDGEALGELPGGTFDAAISRLGLIFFPDLPRALAGIRHVLREGGRIGAIAYSTADTNGFFSIPISVVRRRAQLPPPAPGQPGPFSLGNPGALEAVLGEAGFVDVRVERVDAPVRLASAAEFVQFARESFGALHQMLSGLPPTEREDVWAEIHEQVSQFDRDGHFVAPCRLLVASAAKGVR